MELQQTLYQATNYASLFDYAIFNRDKDHEKSEFLTKLNEAIRESKWFNLSSYLHLQDKHFTNRVTQVPKVDKETQTNEVEALKKVFTEEEIKELATIIKNINSQGVLPITELRDDQDIANKNNSFIARTLSKLFFLKSA